MRVRLPYSIVPDDQGGTYQAVYCNIRLGLRTNEVRTESMPALIDSGAARCLFHSSLASELGLELESGRLEETIGIGGKQDVWIHPIVMIAPGGPISLEAGFQNDLPIFGILGMEGFFEHFIVTFDGLARECQLDCIYRG